MKDETVHKLNELVAKTPDPIDRAAAVEINVDLFVRELGSLLNSYNWDSATNTPDHILAEMVTGNLMQYRQAVDKNARWHR